MPSRAVGHSAHTGTHRAHMSWRGKTPPCPLLQLGREQRCPSSVLAVPLAQNGGPEQPEPPLSTEPPSLPTPQLHSPPTTL